MLQIRFRDDVNGVDQYNDDNDNQIMEKEFLCKIVETNKIPDIDNIFECQNSSELHDMTQYEQTCVNYKNIKCQNINRNRERNLKPTKQIFKRHRKPHVR